MQVFLIEREAISPDKRRVASRCYFLSDDDAEAAAGTAAAGAAGVVAGALSLPGFESWLDFESVPGLEPLPAVVLSPVDFGLALP